MKIEKFKEGKYLLYKIKIKKDFEKGKITYRRIKTIGKTISSCFPFLLRTK